jgi:hypothetical protein
MRWKGGKGGDREVYAHVTVPRLCRRPAVASPSRGCVAIPRLRREVEKAKERNSNTGRARGAESSESVGGYPNVERENVSPTNSRID